ncbi:MAG: hypothetical protein QM758_11215 [Armatimonas sp.]
MWYSERGNLPEAREAFAAANSFGDAILQAGVKAELARLEVLAGNLTPAITLYTESIVLHRELGNSLEVEKLEKERAAL